MSSATTPAASGTAHRGGGVCAASAAGASGSACDAGGAKNAEPNDQTEAPLAAQSPAAKALAKRPLKSVGSAPMAAAIDGLGSSPSVPANLSATRDATSGSSGPRESDKRRVRAVWWQPLGESERRRASTQAREQKK